MKDAYLIPMTKTSHAPCGAGEYLVPASKTVGHMICCQCREVVKKEDSVMCPIEGVGPRELAREDWNKLHPDNDKNPVPNQLVSMMQSFLDKLNNGRKTDAGRPISGHEELF